MADRFEFNGLGVKHEHVHVLDQPKMKHTHVMTPFCEASRIFLCCDECGFTVADLRGSERRVVLELERGQKDGVRSWVEPSVHLLPNGYRSWPVPTRAVQSLPSVSPYTVKVRIVIS